MGAHITTVTTEKDKEVSDQNITYQQYAYVTMTGDILCYVENGELNITEHAFRNRVICKLNNGLIEITGRKITVISAESLYIQSGKEIVDNGNKKYEFKSSFEEDKGGNGNNSGNFKSRK